jgi:phospholipid-binding lipoprotein MlaA
LARHNGSGYGQYYKAHTEGEIRMKKILPVVIVCIFLLVHGALAQDPSAPQTTISAPNGEQQPAERQEMESSAVAGSESNDMDTTDHTQTQAGDAVAEEETTEENNAVTIADPIKPWNTAMYHVNDKFYFWLLKPVSQGYSAVVPEDIRLSVSNFFKNLTTPIRFVSSLLQLNMKKAGNELVRFVYNTTAGVGGLADVAKTDLDIKRQDEDLGQAIGHYGVGHGFYIVWPIFGPSSVRDTVGMVGDWFLDPVYYVNPFEASLGIAAYDKVNETSFHIGDYEELKKAAIDPYVSIRDAYIQHRKKQVEE